MAADILMLPVAVVMTLLIKRCRNLSSYSKNMLHNYNKINMTKLRSFFLAVSAVVLLASCGNSDYKKTHSGIMYKIFSTGSGPIAKRGEILKFHYTQKLNDSVLQSS